MDKVHKTIGSQFHTRVFSINTQIPSDTTVYFHVSYIFRAKYSISEAQWDIIRQVVCCLSIYLPVESNCSLRTAKYHIKKSYVLPTQCIYVFCVDLRTNSDYFTVQH
jgi:hypothetical protein